MSQLPSFQEMRRHALGLLGDAEDELRSDWRPGSGPTADQAKAVAQARALIRQAKDMLDQAAD